MYLPSSLLVVIASFTATALSASSKAQIRDSTSLTLQQQLELAGTAVDRLALLPDDQDFVFDFNASTKGITQGKGVFHPISTLSRLPSFASQLTPQ